MATATPDTLAQFLELGFAAAGTLAGGFFIVHSRVCRRTGWHLAWHDYST